MEEVETRKTKSLVHFILPAASMVLLIAALAVSLMYVLKAADLADTEVKGYFLNVAWILLALMLLAVLMLIWLAIRFVGNYLRLQKRGEKTPYVDAWAEAGKRFKLNESNDPGEFIDDM